MWVALMVSDFWRSEFVVEGSSDISIMPSPSKYPAYPAPRGTNFRSLNLSNGKFDTNLLRQVKREPFRAMHIMHANTETKCQCVLPDRASVYESQRIPEFYVVEHETE